MTRRYRLLTAIFAAALLGAPAAAHAGAFAGQAIDGPGDVTRMGDVDLARDGTGAVAYLKREDGVDHVFVARFEGGAFGPPIRVDAGQGGASSEPVLGVADGGRVAVAWVNGGQAYAALRPAGGPGFGPPRLVEPSGPVSALSLDMSINGVGYLTFTAPGSSAADVRAARLDRKVETWSVLATLDIDPARDAGVGAGRSQVAVSADGTALVVWGEAGRVFGRRVFGTNVSQAPQDLTLPSFGSLPGGAADSPSLDVEDDSSYAWVVFRQVLGDRPRAVARRLVGSQFEPPVLLDGLGDAPGEGAAAPRIDLNGRGVGLAALSRDSSFGVVGARLENDEWLPPARLDSSNAALGFPVTGLGENQDGALAWERNPGDGSNDVRLRYLDEDAFGAETVVSDPAFGPSAGQLGLDGASDRAGNFIVAFLQGPEGGRRLVAGLFDRAPGMPLGLNSQRAWRGSRPTLAWNPAFDLWGAITYRVLVNGKEIGSTTASRLVPAAPIGDGVHRWQISATDRRGQGSVSRTRVLRVDGTKPRVSLRVTGTRKRGRALRFRVRANDVRNPGASGVRSVSVNYGDRTRTSRRTSVHRYGRSGTVRVVVTVKDRAGNVAKLTRRLRIAR